MEGKKKSKAGYWLLGIVIAACTTIGITSLVKYNKRKKEKEKENNQNFIVDIIKQLKAKGIVFGKDDSFLMKVLAKISDEDMNKIIALLKKDKLTPTEKAEIFTLIAKLFTPIDATTTKGTEFSADGNEDAKTKIVNSKETGVVKAADGSGKASLYKINGEKVTPQNQKLTDGNKITVNAIKKIDEVVYFNPFLNMWIKATDVKLDK